MSVTANNSQNTEYMILVKVGDEELARQEAVKAAISAEAARLSAIEAGASEQVAIEKADQALASKQEAESAALSIQSSIQNLGNVTGVISINLNLGTLILATLTGTVTLSFTGLPIESRETAFSLRFTNVQSITFPVGTKFAGGTAPSIIGPRFELPCTINSVGNIIVYGSINNI
jgi:hypothetical protein